MYAIILSCNDNHPVITNNPYSACNHLICHQHFVNPTAACGALCAGLTNCWWQIYCWSSRVRFIMCCCTFITNTVANASVDDSTSGGMDVLFHLSIPRLLSFSGYGYTYSLLHPPLAFFLGVWMYFFTAPYPACFFYRGMDVLFHLSIPRLLSFLGYGCTFSPIHTPLAQNLFHII